MKQESFRIINPETQQVRFVGKQLFNDVDSLRQMGFIQQDLGQESEDKKEVDPKELIEEIAPLIAEKISEVDPFDPLQIGDKMPDPLATPGEEPAQEVVVKRKPGRQPKAV